MTEILASRPQRVVFVGMGPSVVQYLHWASKKKRPWPFDQVWTVNGTSRRGCIDHDLAFVMDDLKTYIEPGFPEWAEELKTRTTPFFTSKAYEDYPASVSYPLDDVAAHVGVHTVARHGFHNSLAYAVALASYMGVEIFAMAGCDFDHPNSAVPEPGKENVSFWLGVAEAKGMNVQVIRGSTMMDRHKATFDMVYGYNRTYKEAPDTTAEDKYPFA